MQSDLWSSEKVRLLSVDSALELHWWSVVGNGEGL